ncbi:MAG: exodeoxyribonuclease VII small subunit [Planctomycetes bacterium]|nr:exodeoxyribonuclease VII small subunit [Planctomycetota bacterium]
MAKKKVAKPKPPAFEDSLAQLEEIVANLEGGKLGLADSLEQYEHGVKHLNACYGLLTEAERRIELVSDIDPTGQARTKPFDDTEGESLEEKSSARSRRRSVKGGRSASREVDDTSSLF